MLYKDFLLKPALSVQRRLPENFDNQNKDFFVDALVYKTCDSYLRFVKNAKVSSDSVIYSGLTVSEETLISPEFKSYYQFRHLLKKTLTCKKVVLSENENYLLVTDLYSTGHFHWFTETVPKLITIGSMASNFVLLLPDNTYIKEVGLSSLRLLQIVFKDIVFMKETEFYKIPNLYFISNVSRSGQMHDVLMKEINKKLTLGKEKGTKRIYISREKARFRKILNEPQLVELLKKYQFEILFAEDLKFEEQIELFTSCQTLLGLHGAGLTNCLFMVPEGNIVELRIQDRNYCYWHLSDSVNHKYYYFNGVPDSDKSLVGSGCNITISLSELEKQVLQKIVK